jgi:pimeloyl-ACP methyl ester carboxylesterase
MQVESFGPADGRPLLLLHGGGVAGWMWDPLRAHLGEGYRIIVPDLPGHGRSADEDYTSHAATIDALTPLLEEQGRPATVVGFSLGAQLAVRIASRRPDLVARVVVISGQALPMPATGATLVLLRATAGLARREWFARLQARQLFIPDELLDDYVRTSATVSSHTLLRSVEENLRFAPPLSWRDYPGDALILVGSKERGIMKRSAATLHDALPGSTLQIVEDCAHGIPLQRPRWLAERIERWLPEGP